MGKIADYQIFRETINNVISNTSLDIGGIYYVLKDAYRDVENLYYAQINQELMEQKKGGECDAESIQQNQLGELSE